MQHAKTLTHLASVNRWKVQPEKQLLLKDAADRGNPFFTDMCRAFVAADIPWHKIENPIFNEFLEKYTKREVPTDHTLRHLYLPKIFSQVRFLVSEMSMNSNLCLNF